MIRNPTLPRPSAKEPFFTFFFFNDKALRNPTKLNFIVDTYGWETSGCRHNRRFAGNHCAWQPNKKTIQFSLWFIFHWNFVFLRTCSINFIAQTYISKHFEILVWNPLYFEVSLLTVYILTLNGQKRVFQWKFYINRCMVLYLRQQRPFCLVRVRSRL